MSSQNNWNNPDMYYQQPQSGLAGGAQNAYGAATYGPGPTPNAYAGPGYPYQQLPPTNTLAIIGLVASIFGVVSSFFIAGVAGIVMGHMALKQIRQRGERGEGLAKGALWVGYIGTALWILFWIVYVLIFVVIFGGAFLFAGTSGVN